MDLEKQITDLNKSGKSLEAILKQLQVPSFNVQTIIFFKYKVPGTVTSLPRSGRKGRLSPAAERKSVRIVKSQPRTTKKAVAEAAITKPFPLRLKFAADHMDKEKAFWRKLLWSDETKIELFDGEKLRTLTTRTQ